MAKIILQGTVKGTRRRGRQKRDEKKTLRNGQERRLEILRGQPKTGKGGKVILQRHLWCLDDPQDKGLR